MTRREDFWQASGHRLLDRNAEGCLGITEDFLRAYLLRPEMLPPEEACANERRLHEGLLEDPRRRVGEAELAALVDPDAIENYRIILAFRDHLVTHGTVERAYLAWVKDGSIQLPPLFADHLVHVVMRSILDGATNPLQARAAELFFRAQRITTQEGQILAADEETVETLTTSGGLGSLVRMAAEAEAGSRQVELDVLDEANAEVYWARSERFDTVLDLTFARPGLDALCRVMEKWIAHFLRLETRIHPVQSIRDQRWRWHCGLDATSSALLNALYQGETVEEERLHQLISLFRLDIKDKTAVIPEMGGRPVYLGLAMDEASVLRMKPQNLLVNLPLAAAT
jgi:hypothetical protein